MRNVAFGILLSALGLLQIAIVSAALSPSDAQTASVAKSDVDARVAVSTTDTGSKTSTL